MNKPFMMRIKFFSSRIPTLLTTTILATCLLFSCQVKRDDTDSINILSIKGPSALALVNMMERFQEADSIKIQYQLFNDPSQIRSLLLRGKADIALVPTNLGAMIYNLGLPYKIALVNTWGTLYLAGSGEDINSLQDLKNKKIYSMGRGMNPDIILRNLLLENNIQPDQDVVLDYSFPSPVDLANALTAGRAPLALLSEPQLSLAMANNPEIRILLDINEEWKALYGTDIPQTAVLIRNDIAANSELLNKLIGYMTWSAEEAGNNLYETARLGVKYNILPDSATLVQAIPRCNIRAVSGEALNKPLFAYLKVLHTFAPETTGGKIPDEQFILQK